MTTEEVDTFLEGAFCGRTATIGADGTRTSFRTCRSVVMFGRIRILDREDEAHAFFTRFMTKYAPADSWGREIGSFPRIPATIVYAITPELVTGKHGVLPPLDGRWPARNNTLSPGWKSRRGSEG
jgi:uncharacterized protein